MIGVAFDGTGYGTDGAVWGGEFFTGDYRGFVRAAHLRYVAMPGGEQAVREPWRMAVAFLADAGQGGDELIGGRVPAKAIASIRLLIDRRLNAPMTSSVGRLFDGVAAVAGVRDRISYEGQAAMELEWLASPIATDGIYPFEILETPPEGSPLQIDTRPLFGAGRGASSGTRPDRYGSKVSFNSRRDGEPGLRAAQRADRAGRGRIERRGVPQRFADEGRDRSTGKPRLSGLSSSSGPTR